MSIQTANFLLSVLIEFLGITLMRFIFFPEGMWEPYIVVFRLVVSILYPTIFGSFKIIQE